MTQTRPSSQVPELPNHFLGERNGEFLLEKAFRINPYTSDKAKLKLISYKQIAELSLTFLG